MMLGVNWKYFPINTPQTFQKLWNDQAFTDVTLATLNNQHVRAHKIILSSATTKPNNCECE